MHNYTHLFSLLGYASVHEIQKKIQDFDKRFKSMKKLTKDDLKKRGKSVEDVTEILTELSADDIFEHKVRAGNDTECCPFLIHFIRVANH